MKPMKQRNFWNQETYEITKPMKPQTYEAKKLIKLQTVWNQETYETTKPMKARNLQSTKPMKPKIFLTFRFFLFTPEI